MSVVLSSFQPDRAIVLTPPAPRITKKINVAKGVSLQICLDDTTWKTATGVWTKVLNSYGTRYGINEVNEANYKDT